MGEKIDYDTELEGDVKRFVWELIAECKAHRKYGYRSSPAPPRKDTTIKSPRNGDTSRKTKPICTYPPHTARGLRQPIIDCRECPEDKKKHYLDEHMKKSRAQRGKGEEKPAAKRVANDKPNQEEDDSTCSLVFSCTYANRTRDFVTADIGSDMNLMGDELLDRITAEGGEVEVRDLTPTRVFNVAVQNSDTSQPVNIICHHTATMPVALYIRHGKTLVVRNVAWMVTNKHVWNHCSAAQYWRKWG